MSFFQDYQIKKMYNHPPDIGVYDPSTNTFTATQDLAILRADPRRFNAEFPRKAFLQDIASDLYLASSLLEEIQNNINTILSSKLNLLVHVIKKSNLIIRFQPIILKIKTY